MSAIKDELDIRHLMEGIVFEGDLHQPNNLLGRHDLHVHDLVDLHFEGEILQCRIIGRANKHLVGEIVAAEFEHAHMKSGRKIVFDEENIFVCHEDH